MEKQRKRRPPRRLFNSIQDNLRRMSVTDWRGKAMDNGQKEVEENSGRSACEIIDLTRSFYLMGKIRLELV